MEKVKNVINEKIATPEEILLLTFSKKAAQEIKERIITEMGTVAHDLTAGTFHSFCLQLLKKYEDEFATHFKFQQFPEVLDEEKKETIIHDILRSKMHLFQGLPVQVIKKMMQGKASFSKINNQKLAKYNIHEHISSIHDEYLSYKKEHSYIDYEDMINYTIDLLQNNNLLKDVITSQYRYILVDEYQDTSQNNFTLLKLLLPSKKPNLCVVGDDWQSIYAFRNANVDYIVNMHRFFPEHTRHLLKTNYRSHKEIVNISCSFIKKNRFRTRKTLLSHKGKGGLVNHYGVTSYEEELKLLQSIVEKKIKNISQQSCAILYRNNWQGEDIKRKLDPDVISQCSLMTMHASKGLEFDTVIITGVKDSIIPHASTSLDEERRLFYVALSRAKKNLYIISYQNEQGELCKFGKELGVSVKEFKNKIH